MPVLDNPKHETIARALAAGESATKALISAGYSPKTAQGQTTRVLKRFPEIRQRSEEIQAADKAMRARFEASREGRKAVDREYVRAGLQEVYERCMQAVPAVDRRGIPTGTYTYDAANALRSLEDMGKDLGMFVERKEIGLPGAFASVEERKAAELRVKAKMVKLGMARVIGSGSAIGQPSGAPAVAKSEGVESSTVSRIQHGEGGRDAGIPRDMVTGAPGAVAGMAAVDTGAGLPHAPRGREFPEQRPAEPGADRGGGPFHVAQRQGTPAMEATGAGEAQDGASGGEASADHSPAPDREETAASKRGREESARAGGQNDGGAPSGGTTGQGEGGGDGAALAGSAPGLHSARVDSLADTETREPEAGPRIAEIEAPETEAEVDPIADQAEADGAAVPPGILQADPDQPDPVSVDRMRTAKPKPVDPGPGPERRAYRNALLRKAGINPHTGKPNQGSRQDEG